MNILVIFVIAIVFFVFIPIIAGTLLKKLKKTASPTEIIIAIIYIFSLELFLIGMTTHNIPYYKAINPIYDECYNPFSEIHISTLLFYFLTFNFSLLFLWVKNGFIPPLALTLSLIFILIGIIINFVILLHLSSHELEDLGLNKKEDGQLVFLLAPFLGFLLGILIIYKAITNEINNTFERNYSNRLLNYLNIFLATKSRKPIWIIILLFPVFFIITLILTLFGQDVNSIVKVFTDTATWRLSQRVHPPILDNKGHYLCTVAAVGHPKIVKPIRIGQRNGNQIIVNRQLQIANAFEELIHDFSPKLHLLIRQKYDKYGYNISTKINSTLLSNITYFLMKPLEWVFLICLYLFCLKPEQKIKSQYLV